MSDIPSDILEYVKWKFPSSVFAHGALISVAHQTCQQFVAKAIYEERKRCARIADEMEPQESSLWSAGSEQNANLFGQAVASGSISKAILSGETKD